MRFDVKKRIFMTKKLIELKSVLLIQRAYPSEYNKKYPTKATILNLSKSICYCIWDIWQTIEVFSK